MKKSKKILSLGLATAMAFSVGASAFAASAAETTYTPEYTEYNTQEDVANMVDQLDTYVDSLIVNGTTLQEIYKVLPALSSVIMIGNNSGQNSATAVFYKTVDPELFAELPDGAVTAESLAAYFTEHPIEVANADDFLGQIENLLTYVVSDNLVSTLGFAAFLAAGWGTNPAGLEPFTNIGNAIDDLCALLGIEQTNELAPMFGWTADSLGNYAPASDVVAYLMNIIRALIPNTVDSVLSLLPSLLVGEGAAELYRVLGFTLENLSGLVQGLSSTLEGLGVNIDDVVNTITQIEGIFNSLPTKETEFGTALDAEATISALPAMLGNILPMFGVELPIDISALLAISFDESSGSGAGIEFILESFNDANIAAAESNADLVMVVANYIYRNLVANEANHETLAGLLEMAGAFLPAEVVNILNALINSASYDEFMWNLRDQVAVLTGNESIGAYPNATEEPTTPTDPTQPSGGDGNTTDTENPATGDAALGAVVMMGTAAAAAIVLLRRKK